MPVAVAEEEKTMLTPDQKQFIDDLVATKDRLTKENARLQADIVQLLKEKALLVKACVNARKLVLICDISHLDLLQSLLKNAITSAGYAVED